MTKDDKEDISLESILTEKQITDERISGNSIRLHDHFDDVFELKVATTSDLWNLSFTESSNCQCTI
jgi:hypothetical protein